jgi:predicted transcriptional regulator
VIKTASILAQEGPESKSEEILFTYSEAEKQANRINSSNAKLVFNWKYLVIPREMFSLGLSGNDVLILSFIHSFLCENAQRFYFTNDQLANIFNLTPNGISKILLRLKEKKLIDLSYSRKADGGQIRFVNLPTQTNYKYQLKQSMSSYSNKVCGNNNKINNNKINKLSVKREIGGEFKNYLKFLTN